MENKQAICRINIKSCFNKQLFLCIVFHLGVITLSILCLYLLSCTLLGMTIATMCHCFWQRVNPRLWNWWRIGKHGSILRINLVALSFQIIDGAIYFRWYGSRPLLRFPIPPTITGNHHMICGGPWCLYSAATARFDRLSFTQCIGSLQSRFDNIHGKPLGQFRAGRGGGGGVGLGRMPSPIILPLIMF